MMSNNNVAEILTRFPGPVALSPSRKKWLLLLLIGAGFVAISLLVIKSHDDDYVYGWLGLIFFSLGSVVAIVAMLPGAGGLKLDREGFEFISLYRGSRVRWQDATGFDAVRIPPSRQIMVVFDDATAKKKALGKLSVAIAGHNSGLPDTYGLDAKDLAALMTQWRERALARP